MNIYNEISRKTDTKIGPTQGRLSGTQFYVGEAYKRNKERVLVRNNGSIVLVIGSEIGDYFKEILNGYGLTGNVDQGKYLDFGATEIQKMGLAI